MAIKSKAEVLKAIVEKEHVVNGKAYVRHEIYFGSDGRGKKIRASRTSRKLAVDHVNEWFRTHKKVGDAITELSAAQIHDAKEAFGILQTAGISKSLADAARRYIALKDGDVNVIDCSLDEAYTEYFAGIPVIQKHHRRAVAYRVRPWVTDFGPGRSVTEVTAKDLFEYLAPIKINSAKTYNNKMSYIKTFLQWCTKDEHKYLRENPAAEMKKARIAYKEPQFLAVEDFIKMVRAIEAREDGKSVMPYLALHYMCGMRREEITRMISEQAQCQWVLLDEESVRVCKPKGWTQGRKPRLFSMPENAVAWIRWGWDGRGEFCLCIAAIYRIIDETAAMLKIKIPKNAGRHSFITYHVAAYETPETTDHITGTSGNMRSSHYQGLTTRQEGKDYFNVFPLNG